MGARGGYANGLALSTIGTGTAASMLLSGELLTTRSDTATNAVQRVRARDP
jgi:hypothetical protein